MSQHDQEKRLDGLNMRELSRAVTRPRGELRSTLALGEIVHRRGANLVPTLAKVLETAEEPEVRAIAVRGLGLAKSKKAQEVLVADLKAKPVEEKRQVIQALSKIGDKDALRALGGLRLGRQQGELREAVHTAQRLIAFRNGISGFEISPPERSRIPVLRRGQGKEMEIKKVSARNLEKFQKRISEEVPGVDLSPAHALQATCLNQRLWLINALSIESAEGLEALSKKPQVPMVIMGYAECSDRPYLYGYAMSQPGPDGVQLFVTRLRGQVTHFGSIKLDDKGATFELNALRTRFAPAARLKGGFDLRRKTLRLDEARASDSFAAIAEMRRKPRLVDTPVPVPSD